MPIELVRKPAGTSNGGELPGAVFNSVTGQWSGGVQGNTTGAAIAAGNVGEIIRNDTYITTLVGVGTTNYDLIVSVTLTAGVWDLVGRSMTIGTASNVQTLAWLTTDSTLGNSPATTDFGRGSATRTLQNSAQDLTNFPCAYEGLVVPSTTTYWFRIKQVGASASVRCTLVAKRIA